MTKHEYIIMNLQGKLITRCGWSSVIAKRCDSTKKSLYTIFFNSEDPVVKVAIPKDRSITWHVYRYYYNINHRLWNLFLGKRKGLCVWPIIPFKVKKKTTCYEEGMLQVKFWLCDLSVTIINISFPKTLSEWIWSLDKSVDIMRVC